MRLKYYMPPWTTDARSDLELFRIVLSLSVGLLGLAVVVALVIVHFSETLGLFLLFGSILTFVGRFANELRGQG